MSPAVVSRRLTEKSSRPHYRKRISDAKNLKSGVCQLRTIRALMRLVYIQLAQILNKTPKVQKKNWRFRNLQNKYADLWTPCTAVRTCMTIIGESQKSLTQTLTKCKGKTLVAQTPTNLIFLRRTHAQSFEHFFLAKTVTNTRILGRRMDLSLNKTSWLLLPTSRLLELTLRSSSPSSRTTPPKPKAT